MLYKYYSSSPAIHPDENVFKSVWIRPFTRDKCSTLLPCSGLKQIGRVSGVSRRYQAHDTTITMHIILSASCYCCVIHGTADADVLGTLRIL